MKSEINIELNGKDMIQITKDLCDFGYRRSGTPPADKAEKYIYDKLKEVGLKDVKLEKLNYTRWWSEKHELMIISEKTPSVSEDQIINSFPAWFCGSTSQEGITAEVAHVGFGTKSDFDEVDVRGKIALIEGKMILNFYPTHSVRLFNTIKTAEKKGALAVILGNNSPLDLIHYINPFDLPSPRDPPLPNLPALSISTPDFTYLKTLCTRYHEKLTMKFIQIAKTEPAISHTVIGTLPGKSDDIILIGTHTDSTFTGALDNAAANAGLIAIAKHYANMPLENREKTMVFAGWTGHECGSIGSKLFVEMHEEMLSKITTYILLDGFGCNGYYNQSDGGVVPTGVDERRGLFVSENQILLSFVLDAVIKYELLPAVYVSARALPVADLPAFIRNEVPSILIIGKPIFYHTKHDTIDIIQPDQLERSAKAHIEIIDAIHATPSEKIRNADGKTLDMTNFITKNEEVTTPSISIFTIPDVLSAGTLAIFVPSVITSPESVILSFQWKFEDGMTSDRLIMVRNFRKPGNYKIIFTIKDNFGNSYTCKKMIRVLEKYRKKEKKISG
ncbi:MAG: M28 family peptidase [Promethearchaeota archaeon]|nr:MAG: M28 family peptidase [Candidatus Lokiarchaeota archaeon]